MKRKFTPDSISTLMEINPKFRSDAARIFDRISYLNLDRELAPPAGSTSLIKLFFDVSHILCYSPMRLRDEPNGNCQAVRSNFILIMIYILLTVLGLHAWAFGLIYRTFKISKTLEGNSLVLSYFLLIFMLANFIRYGLRLNLWRKRHAFARLHTFILNSALCQRLDRYTKMIFVVMIVALFGAVIPLTLGSLSVYSSLHFNGDFFVRHFNMFVMYGYDIAFKLAERGSVNHTYWSQFTRNDILYGVFGTVSYVGLRFDLVCTWLILLLSIISLHSACQSFVKQFQPFVGYESKPMSSLASSNIKKSYLELIKHAELTNDCIQSWIFVYLWHLAFFFPIFFNRTIRGTTWANVDVSIEVFVAIVIVTFACEISRMMDEFKNWLLEEERPNLYSVSELNWISLSLEDQSVGISAGGIFTIDYKFVGVSLSVLLTYFVVILQSGG